MEKKYASWLNCDGPKLSLFICKIGRPQTLVFSFCYAIRVPLLLKPLGNYHPFIHPQFCHCYHFCHFCQSQCPPHHVFGKFTNAINKINLLQTFTLFNCVDMYRLRLSPYIQASDIFSDIPFSYHEAICSPVTSLVGFFLPTFSNIEAYRQRESCCVSWSHIHR